ncbi:hypothetical protein PCASD_22007 [Puccinia coronata f. sp. avenae]|uniref:DUF659 domain-containing protein n=1 Tax=Puccinia coronata f. sp. avenae TaxID=200324 RepID=A0A2N5TZC6_9BASI|nr:hypothetical protein PCASD_22007 [Puccinia coronata f. sp. avenae]
MGRSRKRPQTTGSPTSSISISTNPTKTQGSTPKKQSCTVVDVPDQSDEENNSESPASKQKLSDKQELSKAQKVHAKCLSPFYSAFKTPQLSELLNKHGQRMIAYPCETCGSKIHCPVYDTSPTNLSTHVASCAKREREAIHTQKLSALGISGTGNIDPHKVPQLCAVWCAEGAQPFSALGKLGHRGMLHPVVLKHLPAWKTVSNDISRFYTAVQESFIEELKNHHGVMYLGLDAWQSPNGFDILGTVIYRLVKEGPDGFHLDLMPLDFFKLHKSHTGLYLAETVQLIVEKFGVKEKIHGIVTNNASNNKSMIEAIKSFKWPRFRGNIATVWKPQEIRFTTTSPGFEDDDNNKQGTQWEDMLAAELINDNETKLEDEDLNEMSDKGEDDQYTSNSCKVTLAKFQAILRKLNKSPNSKALFREICQDLKCSKPHNVGRDVCTRWNSTLDQLSSIVRCSAAILEWTKDKRHVPARQYHINQEDLDLARDLVEILQPFYDITLQVSIRGAA